MWNEAQQNELLAWCRSVLGPVAVVNDSSRAHPDTRTAAQRLDTRFGDCYLKIVNDEAGWHREVHGYKRWSRAFGERAPRLLAVRDEVPFAFVVTALPGRILEGLQLPPEQEQAIWHRAGAALPALHQLATGTFFGDCLRDGQPAGTAYADAVSFVRAELDSWTARGTSRGILSDQELRVIQAARERVSVFAGEPAVPCHRDYGPANWLVDEQGAWAGVIDFEFSRWDVRVADFTRYPEWEWMGRPDLIEAFCQGYGLRDSQAFEEQRLIGHVLYALSAVVWGRENQYFGFEKEGRQGLYTLASRLGAG